MFEHYTNRERIQHTLIDFLLMKIYRYVSLYRIRQARRAPPRGAAAGSPKPRSEPSGTPRRGRQAAGHWPGPSGVARAGPGTLRVGLYGRKPRSETEELGRGGVPQAEPTARAGVAAWEIPQGRAWPALTVSASPVLRVVLAVQDRLSRLGRRDSFFRNSRTRLRCKGAPRNRRRLRGRNHSFTYSLLVEVRTKNGRRRER